MIGRGAAIWAESRETALVEVAVTLVDPPVEAGQAAQAATTVVVTDVDARVTALEAALAAALDRIAGLETNARLSQDRVADDPIRMADGGMAEMMDRGAVLMDDSDIAAALV